MSYEKIANLAHQRGFFFRTAESYPNMPAGFWDYGPLGVSLKNKFLELWRRLLVKKDGMVEIDGAQILPKSVFVASGHLDNFNDPIVRCKVCGSFYRPDKLIEEQTGRQVPEKLENAEYDRMLKEFNIKCRNCNSELTGTYRFNMMFKLGIGAAQEEAYLRPETCQTIFVDFPLIFKTQRIKLPVGIAQVGKSFRNEVAPRQGLLRLREITQAEIEVFFNPERISDDRFKFDAESRLNFFYNDEMKLNYDDALKKGLVPNKLIWYYLLLLVNFYKHAGIDENIIRFRVLDERDRAFYSSFAYDLEVKLSLGWLELVACNYRSNYDLTRHQQISGSDFSVEDDGKRLIPHVFELSMGVDRSIYSILELSYTQEEERKYLRLRPYLAPVQVSVFPLLSKDGLDVKAHGIYRMLMNDFDCFYDESGSIGRRYARADEIGVPYCVTIDYDTLKDETVTIRERDTKKQERIKVIDLRTKLSELLSYPKIA